MNLSLRRIKKWLLYFGIWLSPLFLAAQASDFASVTIYMEQVLEYEFHAIVFASIEEPPQHGTVSTPQFTSNGFFRITYIPQPGFIGTDVVVIDRMVSEGFVVFPKFLTLEINVKRSLVVADKDFVSTYQNTPVTIPVLDNDYGNRDTLILKEEIPLVNYGVATVDDNGTSITFVPNDDFVGTAQFNYVVCDDQGTCDVGLVTVFVEYNYSTWDTIELFTKMNEPLEIVVPLYGGYVQTASPSIGSVTPIDEGTMVYTPSQDAIGDDAFTLAINTITGTTALKTFTIHVLDIPPPPEFAVDDYVYTAINTTISIDALENDFGSGLFTYSFTTPANGTVYLINGEFIYNPDQNFEGVDFFSYTVCTPGWDCEQANVYIEVSNQVPSAEDTILLTTPQNTPLVVFYYIPISIYGFDIAINPSHGEVQYFEGNSTVSLSTPSGPQDVSGYNMVVYTPDPDFLGHDYFKIFYCIGNDCHGIDIRVNVIELDPVPDEVCINDCVWSGDTNTDGIVNMKDLLSLGYCIGQSGPNRPQGEVAWYGQYGPDWEASFGETDIKHVDADGNGFIASVDTQAISQFYQFQHNLVPSSVDVSLGDGIYFLMENITTPGPSDMVELQIHLGRQLIPAIDIHGLTFDLTYNPAAIYDEEESVQPIDVEFVEGNWMSYNSPMIGMMKRVEPGLLHVGYTRTTGAEISGYGPIATIRFIIRDDLEGIRLPDSLRVAISASGTVDRNGRYIAFKPAEIAIPLRQTPTIEFDENDLIVYPNPANSVLNLYLNGANNIRQAAIYSMLGHTHFLSGSMKAQQFQLSVNDLPNGMYILDVETEKGVITKKFEVLK